MQLLVSYGLKKDLLVKDSITGSWNAKSLTVKAIL